MSMQAIVEDLEATTGVLPGYIFSRVKERLQAALDGTQECGEAEYLEALIERVRRYYQQLVELDVPPQELGRHQRLLCAFEVYEEALEAFLQCLGDDQLACDPELIEDLNWADHVVREHRERYSKHVEISAVF